ncbi:MAG TPA: glycosyltransferase family 4 protein [Thermoanaerobaculia bacterium]|nr:glycosyltransferase family 4 protein [Thermoanaerobaculia bacterium]
MPDSSLRILITCRELAVRAGTQLYTRDVAEELRRLGHSPVVFSPRLGEVAAEIRSRGIAVIDSLDRLGEPPDVIHGQHHLEAMQAMLRFPTVPALYVCHGWLPWQEAPPRFPSLARYVAVDALRRDRLVLEHGIPESHVTVLHNFVDLDRFRPRPPLPPRPRRALLLSNQASARTFVPEIERACAASGLELTVAGFAAGRSIRPEEILASHDLVFARGRAALEAMAVGAAVVLCDLEGSGPLVDSSNFDTLRNLNFGMGALRPPVEEERLRAAIGRYDPEDAARVRDRVRREAGREEAVEVLVGLYRELLAMPRADAQDCLRAASLYLSWLGPHTETAEDELARTAAELAAAQATLQALERSPFLRLRASLLGLTPLVALYRAVKGWSG